jgi:hypothetical protein
MESNRKTTDWGAHVEPARERTVRTQPRAFIDMCAFTKEHTMCLFDGTTKACKGLFLTNWLVASEDHDRFGKPPIVGILLSEQVRRGGVVCVSQGLKELNDVVIRVIVDVSVPFWPSTPQLQMTPLQL